MTTLSDDVLGLIDHVHAEAHAGRLHGLALACIEANGDVLTAFDEGRTISAAFSIRGALAYLGTEVDEALHDHGKDIAP